MQLLTLKGTFGERGFWVGENMKKIQFSNRIAVIKGDILGTGVLGGGKHEKERVKFYFKAFFG